MKKRQFTYRCSSCQELGEENVCTNITNSAEPPPGCNYAGEFPVGFRAKFKLVSDKKVLRLTLKKKWFDMILSGEKPHEYREIKPYWTNRLSGKSFDLVEFRNGYGKKVPWAIFELENIITGFGETHWGAPPNSVVYVLRLGKLLNYGNIKNGGD